MREPARVLVVDDEPLNLEIIAELLDDTDYQLRLFDSAVEAWAHLQQGEIYDLILLDRMMPGMDGIQLLRGIKADPRYRQTPVVMQTAASSPEQVNEGIAAGAYYYLAKPYSGRELRAIVHAALSEPASPIETATPIIEGVSFEFRTLAEARQLAARVALRCHDPELAAMGLGELFTNAIEHGNLGIRYEEKKNLRLSDTWEAEVERRLSLPEFAGRKVKVELRQTVDALVITVSDCGPGFDWQRFLAIDPARAFDPNGRGIAVARELCFSSLEYQGSGNVAVVTIPLQPARSKPT